MPEAPYALTNFNSRTATRCCAGAVMVIGAACLAGWVFGIPALTRIHLSLVTMKANMALSLVLLGLSLWLLQDEAVGRIRRRLAQGCAAVVVLVAMLTLIEQLWHVDLGIDMLIVTETKAQAGPSIPGRFGLASAVTLMLSGTALMFIDVRARGGRYAAPYLAFAAAGITFLVGLSYAYGAGRHLPFSRYFSISIHSMVPLFFLYAGILLARPGRSIMATCLSGHVGGILARRLVPAAVFLPALLGWLLIIGQNAGWYDTGLGTAMFATSLIGIFTLLVARTARSLNDDAAIRVIEEERLKAAQGEAERASHAKDAFLAALSHELRTPLTPVLMMAAALRDDERLPADVREHLDMMERNIALEARLIDDLLDLTSIARGKLRLQTQRCDAHSLIDLAIEIVREDAQARGVNLDREYAALRSGLDADPARFQQVIWNLLRNAVKFTPRGGRVAIRTWDVNDDRLGIEVSDSGIGIEPAAMDQIFLPFDQGGLSGDHRFGGMGLGLSIARTVVDMHGGQIKARSEGRDKGATFTVELPGAVAPSHGEGACVPLARGELLVKPIETERTPRRLLLVDDHAPTLAVLALLLRRAGDQVVTATTVSEALAAAARESFDGVISDLGLPDGTGSELMVQLRDSHRLRGIALSGYGMQEDISRSLAAGFETHLIKPVDFAQLSHAIAAWGKGEE